MNFCPFYTKGFCLLFVHVLSLVMKKILSKVGKTRDFWVIRSGLLDRIACHRYVLHSDGEGVNPLVMPEAL